MEVLEGLTLRSLEVLGDLAPKNTEALHQVYANNYGFQVVCVLNRKFHYNKNSEKGTLDLFRINRSCSLHFSLRHKQIWDGFVKRFSGLDLAGV